MLEYALDGHDRDVFVSDDAERIDADPLRCLDPEAKPRNSRVFLDGIANIQRVPSISTWPEIEDASEGILENGMYLGQDPRTVAAELEDATTPIFARADR